MPRGRPRKNPESEVAGIESLVESPALFENDMRHFFLAGKPQRLKRWFISNPENAELIAAHMVEWFRNKLAELLPEGD